MVTQQEFKTLFVKNKENAIAYAEEWFSRRIPREYLIELHGAGVSGKIMSVDEALDKLYISPDRFWFVIDISVEEFDDKRTCMFVRASGHPPVPWSRTWQQPPGQGPFKILGPRIRLSLS